VAAQASVADFMVEVRSMLTQGVNRPALTRVGELLATTFARSEFSPEASLRAMHKSDSSASLMQSDPDGLTLVLAEFSAKAETPVHDHGAWGVACVLRGSDRYRHYDPPSGAGSLPQLRFERVLGPGDFVTWLEPPDDIHSQQGIGEAAIEIVLFGKNVMAIPRRYYDLSSGRVTTALPQ
jgi:predicted metal-dependent enzyme (double-stranded beta helix superfamily)